MSLHVKAARYDDACQILMRYAAACEGAGMRSSLSKSYLGERWDGMAYGLTGESCADWRTLRPRIALSLPCFKAGPRGFVVWSFKLNLGRSRSSVL